MHCNMTGSFTINPTYISRKDPIIVAIFDSLNLNFRIVLVTTSHLSLRDPKQE